METGYHYVVVTIGNVRYFINTDMDYTDNFADVLRFDSGEDALDFIRRRHLYDKDALVLEVAGPA
jgi:anionic cell wall polymer biosynthesis LytR-Cps2A-Psr (LCP) family protein